MLAIGASLLLYGLLTPVIAFAGPGAAILFIGVFVLGPAIARPITRIIGAPIARFRGVTGAMASQNALRNPKRTARTASALTIGVALVAGVTVLVSSFKTSIANTISETFIGDFVVDSGAFGPNAGLSPKLVEDLAALPEVKVASGLQLGLGDIDGDGSFFGVFDPDTTFQFIDLGITAGEPAALVPGTIFVHDDRALDLGVDVGDSLTATFPGTEELTLRIVGIYQNNEYPDAYVVNVDDYASGGSEQLLSQVFVQLNDSVDIENARPQIAAVAANYPNGELQDLEAYIEAQGATLNQILGLFYMMLTMAIIIAAFGIMNTLRLSVIERTREIGLLRAVGTTRGQLKSAIRWEAVITSVFGAILGVGLGLFLGYSIIVALRDLGSIAFSVPWLALVVVVILAALVGVLTSLWPASRAAKLNVLDAIAS